MWWKEYPRYEYDSTEHAVDESENPRLGIEEQQVVNPSRNEVATVGHITREVTQLLLPHCQRACDSAQTLNDNQSDGH